MESSSYNGFSGITMTACNANKDYTEFSTFAKLQAIQWEKTSDKYEGVLMFSEVYESIPKNFAYILMEHRDDIGILYQCILEQIEIIDDLSLMDDIRYMHVKFKAHKLIAWHEVTEK